MKLSTPWFRQIEAEHYTCTLAQSTDDLEQAQRLRFEVFNLELKEGLSSAYETGLDADPFDSVCDHLIVRHKASQQVIGTYRLQSGTTAAQNLGYYSEQEFDFTPYEAIRHQVLELGRACVHKSHRNLSSLSLLWKGIACYARVHDLCHLIGCSSLTSQNPAEGLEVYRMLSERFHAPRHLSTYPHPEFACVSKEALTIRPDIPKLLRAYLTVGARICGPPALDQSFGTIDFLTLLNLRDLSPRNLKRYF